MKLVVGMFGSFHYTLKIFLTVEKSMTFKSINFVYMLLDISLALIEEMEFWVFTKLNKKEP